MPFAVVFGNSQDAVGQAGVGNLRFQVVGILKPCQIAQRDNRFNLASGADGYQS